MKKGWVPSRGKIPVPRTAKNKRKCNLCCVLKLENIPLHNNSKTTFLVKSGTRGQFYRVNFELKNERMFVRCNCPAGRFGKFYKHKIGLIQDTWEIVDDHEDYGDKDPYKKLGKIQDWFQRSEFLDLIFERSPFKMPLAKALEKVEEIRSRMRPVEKKMAEAMKRGIKLR